MSRFVTISLKGYDELQKRLKKVDATVKREVGLEVQDAGNNWSRLAKLAAPTDQGRLKNEITSKKTGPMSAEPVSAAEHSAYIEWGTLTKVKVPAELAAYAAQFKGSGSGDGTAKQKIYAWMKRVGISKDRQYMVFIAIITKGIRPHPYFFIQRPIVEKQYIENIKRILLTPH